MLACHITTTVTSLYTTTVTSLYTTTVTSLYTTTVTSVFERFSRRYPLTLVGYSWEDFC